MAGFDDQSAARPGSGFESFGEARYGKLVYGGREVGGREPFGLSGFGQGESDVDCDGPAVDVSNRSAMGQRAVMR